MPTTQVPVLSVGEWNNKQNNVLRKKKVNKWMSKHIFIYKLEINGLGDRKGLLPYLG